MARGLHPAVLSGHGLDVALQSLVAHAPRSRAAERRRSTARLPEQIEVAAYYVVSREPREHRQARARASVSVDGVTRRRPRGRRGRRRRRRRRRQRARLGSARSRRPGRGAGGRLRVWSPARRRNPRAGGDAVRVAIAEDSVLLREGLARLLGEAGFDVVGQCGTADDLLLKVRSYRPTSRSSTSGCRRRTATRGCARRSRSARSTRRWACSCCRSTSSSGSR